MLINVTVQVLWISYAPITGLAADYSGVSELAIGILAMSSCRLHPSVAADRVADRHARLPRAVGFGIMMMALFGVAHGLAGPSYTLVLVCTIGIAVAQPFSSTRGRRWDRTGLRQASARWRSD